MKDTHEGHRYRLAGKVRDGGVLYDHEMLEVLLFNACPRRDLNATAHALLDRFGDLYGVMHASVEELSSVHGVGENMAEYIHCLSAVLDNLHNCESFAELKNTSDFLDHIRADCTLRGGLLVCLVDKDGRIRRKFRFKTSPDGQLQLKELYANLAVSRPYGVFAGSVRETDDCQPSPADDAVAESINRAVGICGARLYDYCIVGADGSTYSYFVNDRSIFGNGEIADRGKKRGNSNG